MQFIPFSLCSFCALSVPEIQAHISSCSLSQSENSNDQLNQSELSIKPQDQLLNQLEPQKATPDKNESLQHINVDVKPSLKREPFNIKQEIVDPLKEELKTNVLAEDNDDDEVLTVSDTSEVTSTNDDQHECKDPGCSFTTKSLSSFKAHMLMHQRKGKVYVINRNFNFIKNKISTDTDFNLFRCAERCEEDLSGMWTKF